MSACSVVACDRPSRALDLCPTHYKRVQRGASSSGAVRGYRQPFDSFIARQDGCWLWTGSLMANGYGRYRVPGEPQDAPAVLAHRFSYERANGPIPDGLQLDHLCRNRACVNPDHLEPVTPAENLRRARLANGASA